jgi:membrane-associated phospholipid phosphatase
MSPARDTFWHWPGWGRLGHFAVLGLAVNVWFAVIYGGANYITSLHSYRVRVHLDAELHIPFVPAAVLGYLSINLLLWSPAFILRTRRELDALAWTLAAVILAGGVCFVLVPVESAFPPPGEMGAWAPLVRGAKRVALEYNFLPSLHVGLSVICIAVYARQASPLGRALLWGWSGVIGLCTLLLHQHYLLDVVGGFALGLAGVRVVYDRLASKPFEKVSGTDSPANDNAGRPEFQE